MPTPPALPSLRRTLIVLVMGAAFMLSAVAAQTASAATTNLLSNPSLESASGSIPTCMQLGGYGTNSYSWTRTTDAHTGNYAESLTVSSLTGGDRKLLSAQDSGACAPAATAGHTYAVGAWYKTSAGSPKIFAYYRNSSGAWTYWAQSGKFAGSSSWAYATWTTPAFPSGATHISVGMGLKSTGSVTMDDFSLVDNVAAVADTTAPTVPGNLSAAPRESQVALSWSASTDVDSPVTGYYVYRGATQIATITSGTSYTDTGLTDGTGYSYHVTAYDPSGNVSPASTVVTATPLDTTAPSVPSNLVATAGNSQVTLSWNASADNVGVAGYNVYRNGSLAGTASGTSYTETALTNGTTYSYTIAAYDLAGNTSAQSSAVSTTPSSGGSVSHFYMAPSSQNQSPPSGYPQSDSVCASEVRPAAENRPNNTTANNTVPSNPSAIAWGTGDDSFSAWPADRGHTTGNYTGTTDQIFQWGACKWGIEENLYRAVSVQESHWNWNDLGDVCGPVGEASYGIMQVKNQNCSGSTVHGGYPYTQNDTALNVDFYGAHFRACVDGAFSGWLYGGGTVAQWLASHTSSADPVPITGNAAQDSVIWGCVGFWFSGGWYDSGAQSYISGVQGYYTSRPWLSASF